MPLYSLMKLTMKVGRILDGYDNIEHLTNTITDSAERNKSIINKLSHPIEDDFFNRIGKTEKELRNIEVMRENREMKAYIAQRQRDIEKLMQKYREHVGGTSFEHKYDMKTLYNEKLVSIICKQQAKIEEMLLVMDRAANLDASVENVDETIADLIQDNNSLRVQLQLANETKDDKCQDKAMQTNLDEIDDMHKLALESPIPAIVSTIAIDLPADDSNDSTDYSSDDSISSHRGSPSASRYITLEYNDDSEYLDCKSDNSCADVSSKEDSILHTAACKCVSSLHL